MLEAVFALLLFLLAGQVHSAGFLCKECVQLTTSAQEVLSDPHNLESAIAFVKEHSCGVLPESYKHKCDDMAEEYVSLVFTTLEEYVTPEVCFETGLCTGDVNVSLEKKENCAFCRYVVLQLKIKLNDPKTQEKLLEYMIKNCQQLHKRENECKLLVLEYGPQLLASLETLLSEKDLCATIGLCNKSQPLHESM